MVSLFVAGFLPAPAVCQEVQQEAQRPELQKEAQKELDDAISRVKLKADSLPDGFEITSEVRATKSQIYKVRTKIGFPLATLLNQKIICEGYQARLNYMALPNESWVSFGYSRLMKSEGQKGMVMVKNGVLIQMMAPNKELEDLLILLLRIDRLQTHKLRFHRFPEGWILDSERFLTREELGELEQQSDGTILQGLLQEIIVNRTRVNIMYFDCKTQQSADLVGRTLDAQRNRIEERVVKGYGSIVVAVDSTNADLSRQMLSHMNW
jgi:hypothetical protein